MMVQQLVQPKLHLGLENFHGIVSCDPQMKELFALLHRVARSDFTVLIHGETGSGKELVARAIHAESRRRHRPFRTVNCATLSPTLLESELFGHKRGAFTGAIRDHPGLFRAAHRGTLFLDEVAEIPLDLQGRLLRVLQEKTFLPLGETQPVTVDVRIISATNRSLRQEVAAGRFREDLSYRIRVVPVYLPPLRDRPKDVEALFWHFVNEMNGRGLRTVHAVTRRALNAIVRYTWPGNVRELHSMVQHAFAVEEGPVLDLVGLTPEVRGESIPGFEAPAQTTRGEKDRIRSALAKHGARKSDAARELGMSRQTLWRKMTMYGLR